jgi:hypothetical protein
VKRRPLTNNKNYTKLLQSFSISTVSCATFCYQHTQTIFFFNLKNNNYNFIKEFSSFNNPISLLTDETFLLLKEILKIVFKIKLEFFIVLKFLFTFIDRNLNLFLNFFFYSSNYLLPIKLKFKNFINIEKFNLLL